MKNLFTSLSFLFLAGNLVAQPLFSTNTGESTFYSKAPVEDIEAVNKKASLVVNITTKEVASKIPIRSFKFPNSLMEEHFNENYMESEKYPHATFKGKIAEDIDFTKEGTHTVSVPGKLTIHGVEKDKTLKGTLTVSKDKIDIHCEFDVPLEEHKIERPSLVLMKIAEVIKVKNHFVLSPVKPK